MMETRSRAFETALCVSAFGVLLSGSALADEDRTGVEIGFRTGYSIAMGSFEKDSDLSDVISGAVPLWLDLGYRVIPSVSVGIYGMYGFGFMGSSFSSLCDTSGVSCGTHDIRIGAEVQYHILPFQKVDPWVGVGFGYEWLSISASASELGVSAEADATVHGFQFFDLQTGVDFLPMEDSGFGFGPFIDFALGEYSGGSCSASSNVLNLNVGGCSISNTALHEWFTLGVRGTFVP